MSETLKRREWLKSGAALTAGLFFGATQTYGNYSNRNTSSGYKSHFTGEVLPDFGRLAGAAGEARLWANENPYGPSAAAKKVFIDNLNMSNRYPFSEFTELKEVIAKKEGVTVDHIIIGGGLSEVLALVGICFGLEKGSIISAFPTFSALLDMAGKFDCDWQQVPLDKDNKHDLKGMASGIKSDTRLVYICNPGNPAPTVVPTDQLKEFCLSVSKKKPVFVDEAYLEFMENRKVASMVDLVQKGHNIVVGRTLSKIHGFAGLRVGYAIAQPEVVKKISNFQGGMTTVSINAIKAATASLRDEKFLDFVREKNAEAKKYVYKVLDDLNYSYTPSHTNFILFQLRMDSDKFIKEMKEKGVAIRGWHFNDKHWCRVSLGTMKDMEAFAKALKEVS